MTIQTELDADLLPIPPATWSTSPIAMWLADHGGRPARAIEIVERLCALLVREGVPLLRVVVGIPAMHPLYLGSGITWMRGLPIEELRRERSLQDTPAYRESPIALIHQGAGAIRRRLESADAAMDFPILPELRALGATDYVVMPLRFTRDRPSFISWTTDAPGGFTARQLALLDDLLPLIALRLEVSSSYRMMRDVLNTYLGRNAGKKVFNGSLERSQGLQINAAIWYCDLRGFTAMSDRMGAHDLIATLDDYFDCMAMPVHGHGGEVLKFIGDGMLAIFRTHEQGVEAACAAALDAAIDGFDELHTLNQGRAIGGGAPLRVGIGLHLGEVIYGNIGARDRLDFTVIGRAVNEVSRVEAMTARLSRPLLTSADFAAQVGGRGLDSLGFHVLRGLREPQELFGLPLAAIPGGMPD